ncbi:hypothetical protein LCGC14_0195960 [marine sediment metagenome]|uniref:Uncharacterized protein n=1 Tax=marine sediment metagenome TaxID=412755 RepID=A0A0F9XNK4_9ZZZZ
MNKDEIDFKLIHKQRKTKKMKQICAEQGYPYDKTRSWYSRWKKERKPTKKTKKTETHSGVSNNIAKQKKEQNPDQIPTYNELFQFFQNSKNHVDREYWLKPIKRGNKEVPQIFVNKELIKKVLDAIRDIQRTKK